jgi:hypothetical protein
MYRTGSCKFDVVPKIDCIEVDKVTPKSVWILGQRFLKQNEYEHLHDTWEEAHRFLLQTARDQINLAVDKVESADKAYGDVLSLKQAKEPLTFPIY